jgi:predicted transposase/invertase (TIGR01784 family)
MTKNLHDKGYKRLFSNKLFFRQLIETFVTEEWVKDIDFDQLEKMDKSFISAHYKETESDIIYRVKFNNEDAYIYLLLEFQSTVNWFMALRMLNYISNFYMDYVERDKKIKKLPPIFPLVLYNGDDRWTAATDFSALLEKPDLLKHYTPQLHYFKIAENEYDTDNLLQISNLASTLFLVENKQNIELIKTELLNLFDKQEDKEAISILLNWFKQLSLRGKQSKYDYHAIETIYQTKDEARTMLETTLERYGQDFFVKGKVEGKAEMLIMLLEERFGNLSREQKENIYHFNDKRFTQAFKKLLTLKNLTDIFQ